MGFKSAIEAVAWTYRGDVDRIQDRFRMIDQNGSIGTLHVQIDDVALKAFWLADDAIKVLAEARGTAMLGLAIKP